MLKPFPKNIRTPVELGEEYSYPCNYACTPVTSMEVTSSIPVRPNLGWTIGKAANMTCSTVCMESTSSHSHPDLVNGHRGEGG